MYLNTFPTLTHLQCKDENRDNQNEEVDLVGNVLDVAGEGEGKDLEDGLNSKDYDEPDL